MVVVVVNRRCLSARHRQAGPHARLSSTSRSDANRNFVFLSVPSLVPDILENMSSFSLPQINDNPDGGWGPSSSNFPSQFKFKDIPYAPYSKSDKLGRFADWNDPSDGRQTNLGLSSTQASRGGGPGRRGRDGQPAFGSGTASAFAYFHAEDESSFSLVDNKATTTRRGGAMARGRTPGRGGGGYGRGGNAQRQGRGGYSGGRGGGQRGGRRGWRDWEKVSKIAFLILIHWQTFFALCRQVARGSRPLRSLPTGPCLRRSNSTVLRSSGWRLTSLKICKLFLRPVLRPELIPIP